MQHYIRRRSGVCKIAELALLLAGVLFLCHTLAHGAQALPDISTGLPVTPAPELFGPAAAASAASAPHASDAPPTQPLLTTRNGKIVDQNGAEVAIKGLGWLMLNT